MPILLIHYTTFMALYDDD